MDKQSLFDEIDSKEDEVFKVTVGTTCEWLRDNRLGLYCRLGTRVVRRIGKVKIVCLDCDEQGKPVEDLSSGIYKRIKKRERNG